MSNKQIPESVDLGLFVNFPVADAIAAAPADPEAAARVLLLAARILRNRQPIPLHLADYLADAFEAAMAKPEADRVVELGVELNIGARNRRPSKFDWFEAYRILVANPMKSNAELVALIKKKGKCSESHARKILKQAVKAKQNSDEILRQEGLGENAA